MRKLLIVTADDCGLHDAIDEGIVAAAEQGIVTSISVAPNGATFDAATAKLRHLSDVSIGAHLNLTDGQPLTEPRRLAGLVDPRSGRFLGVHRMVAARIALRRVSLAAVRDELAAQLRRLAAAGFELSHVNTHGHLHMLPALFRITVELANGLRVPFIRFPVEEPRPRDLLHRRGAVVLGSWVAGQWLRSMRAWPLARRTDHFRGLRYSGQLSIERLRTTIRELGGGVTELMVHPGRDTRELRRAFSWYHDWPAEQQALCDARLRDELDANQVRLVSFLDAAKPAASA